MGRTVAGRWGFGTSYVFPATLSLDATADAGWADFASMQQTAWQLAGYLYWTSLKNNGDVTVHYRNLSTGATGVTVLHAALSTDQHLAPVLLVRSSDHKLLVYYSTHNDTAIRLRISTNSLDSDPTLSGGFAAESNVITGGAYTYPQVHEITAGIVITYRRDAPNATFTNTIRWGLRTSSDGVTWGAETLLVQEPNRGAYLQSWKTATNRIDFLCTDGAHGNQTDISVYHFYYDGTTYRTTDGTAITASQPYQPSTVLTRVFNGASPAHATAVNAVALGADGNPVCAFRFWQTYSGPEDLRYYYGYWDGAAWQTHQIAANGAGAIWGNVTLDPVHPEIVFYGRLIGSQTEMCRGLTCDHGTTFTEQQLTITSAVVNTTPVPVINPSSDAQVVWMRDTWANGSTPMAWGSGG